MVEKYLDAFPYSVTYIPEGTNFLFFLKELGSEKKLQFLDLDKSQNLEDSYSICDEDFSKRSYRPIRFNSENNKLYLISDDDNKENYNIYSVNLSSKKFSQVTETTYCGVYGFDKNFGKLVFGDRYKKEKGKYFTRLFLMDMESGVINEICNDFDWEYRLSWSDVAFDEKNNFIIVSVDWQNQRKKQNLIKISLDSGEYKKLLNEQSESSYVSALSRDITDDNFYFVSDKNGFENIYWINPKLEVQDSIAITTFDIEASGTILRDNEGIAYMTLADYKNDESILNKIYLNGQSKPHIEKVNLKGSNRLSSSRDLWIYSSNIDSPPELTKYLFDSDLMKTCQINLYKGKKEELIHNQYKYVEYKSFDGKTVPAYLSLPKGKLNGAVITAFYGGTNYYYWVSQLFSELGLAELSPAVRGSWTHGSEWRDLIKGDLGGDEILDLHWGAKFLENELGLMPEKIGLEGGSHGGYSVLRGLTMPEGFKNIDGSSYPYGFGVCWAGFADLEDFYHTSNIPDWLVDMLGPFEQNKDKYRERSPINYFDNLKTPLFISHGLNDPRVSPSSMEGFLSKLKGSDKDHEIHMMKGLGHGAGNKKEDLEQFEKMASFIRRVLEIR